MLCRHSLAVSPAAGHPHLRPGRHRALALQLLPLLLRTLLQLTGLCALWGSAIELQVRRGHCDAYRPGLQ